MFGGDEKQIVLPFAGNVDGGNVERLSVDRTIHLERAQLSERAGVDVLRGERLFVESRSRPLIVILRGENLRLGARREVQQEKANRKASHANLCATSVSVKTQAPMTLSGRSFRSTS